MSGFVAVVARVGTEEANANVTIDGQSGVTPVTFTLAEGTYTATATYQGQVTAPQTVIIVANQTSNIAIQFPAPQTTVKFNGVVSAQASAGETVTITVTKPDNTTEILTAQTLADRTYATSKEFSAIGTYKAKAHGDADAKYTSWDSAEVSFSIALTARTGTLVVSV